MKTLVMHPQDSSTDFLKICYENHLEDKEWTIINDFSKITKKRLKELIKENDKIIMMGHGFGQGLFNPNFNSSCKHLDSLLIDDSHAPLLKEKETISIWCFSDRYFKRHNIKGFHTGMIISEVKEAEIMLAKNPFNEKEILDNMVMFATAIRDCIDKEPKEMQEYVLKHYVGDDAVTQFNRKNIIVL